MKKDYFSQKRPYIIILCFILFIIVCAVSGIRCDNIAHAEINLTEYQYNTNRSVEIYKTAMNPFRNQINESEYEYSDNFAGVYIDDEGYLNIGVIGNSYVANTYGERVIYKQQKFAYNYLQNIINALSDNRAKEAILSTAIDAEKTGLKSALPMKKIRL